jgi:signal transduction histidine kinase
VNKAISEEAAFMGRITAGVTHEMKNVLAIIKESAGLMEDILALTKDSPAPDSERFTRVISSINKQVERGVDLSTRLNAFAHSPDTRQAEIDLNILLDQVACLSARFARLKRVGVSATPQPEPVTLLNDPLRLHMLFVDCIDRLLQVAPAGSAIHMEPVKLGRGRVEVRFSPEGGQQTAAQPVGSDALEGLRPSAEAVKGTIEPGEPPVWFTIVFP